MNLHESIVREAVLLAEAWQERANELLSPEEKRFQNKMMRLLSHAMDKVILTRMIDQSFRSKKTGRVADQISNLFEKYGIPSFFSPVERLMTSLFSTIGRYFSLAAVPLMIQIIRRESRHLILPGEPSLLTAHLEQRKNDCVRMNLNHLGEAVLGEGEALSRLKTYLEDLRKPEVENISVKISTLHSQILPIAADHCVSVLSERLSMLYKTAMDHFFVAPGGKKTFKFVNLDMEEFRDVWITVEAFIKTLSEDAFKNFSAGIVLQSYLPESYEIQQQITNWAKQRAGDGGSPIKIRIVKGANMEMEKVESALNNWPLAPYDNKLEVDANFKRMVEFGMRPENIEAAYLGVASHNLFDLAYAWKLAEHHKVTSYFTFEMLEGMADHVRRAIQETSGDMLLYAPVATKTQFISAIGYLIRRLDENTAEENFLRYASHLKTGSVAWSFLKDQFLASFTHREKAGTATHRIQNRNRENPMENQGTFFEGEFSNEPDTDWSLPENRMWAEAIKIKWKKCVSDRPLEIPLVVAGEEIFHERETLRCSDRSQIDNDHSEGVCVALCALANAADVDQAVRTAKDDPDGWRKTCLEDRHSVLSRVAMNLRQARPDLIGMAAAFTGKIFSEADVEVSEAIDFVEYYPYSARALAESRQINCTGKGVGLIISPWNFPIAIPCGGIVAALSAGNTVIFKPASAAIGPAWRLCQCFWEAGVSKKVLQFLPCSGALSGEELTRHPDVDFIIFTGGTGTALTIAKRRPEIYLAAETGGKNATIVTAMSDRDQAIKNVVHSAFSNCGQKCSATSLLILEKEVYNDLNFKKHLVDAAQSWSVGSAWDFENKMGPLIHPPEGKLKNALTQLEPGEEWALAPKNIRGNPCLWTPGIKWGVMPGSVTHMTEFFGPLLGVMCAKNLAHAIELANRSGYGLTAGLESLDVREQEFWKRRIKAGNLYINRGTTGAIVLRQPFGGIGKSSIGPGIKAGGPNYVIQFMDVKDKGAPYTDAILADHPLLQLTEEWKNKLRWGQLVEFEPDLKKTIQAVKSYLYAKETGFSLEKDFFHLRGQDNIIRYLPLETVAVRVHPEDSLFEILGRIAAARISGCKLVVSIPPELISPPVQFLLGKEGKKFTGPAEILFESDEAVIDLLQEIQGLRYAALNRAPVIVFKAAAEKGFYVSRTRVVMEGRVELLQYHREQSICTTYHRYGNLGERGDV